MYYDRNKRKKQSLIIFLVVLAVIGFIGFWIFKKIESGRELYIIKGNGRIESREVSIAAKFSGRVIELNVDEGSVVKKGDLLATIDYRTMTSDLEVQKAKAEEISKRILSIDANIKGTKSDLNFYEKEVDRSKVLMKQKFASQLEMDQNNNKLEKTKAKLASLEADKNASEAEYKSLLASIQTAEINIEDMKIYAPSDGVILYRLVENGEMVSTSGRMFIMYNPDDLYMTIYMSSNFAGKVKLGDEAIIKLDAYKDKDFKAKVTFVAQNAEFTPKEVETQTEREKLMFRVKLTLNDNVTREAKPGMPGDGYIKIDNSKDWPEKLK